MPGICGIVEHKATEGLSERISQMLILMTHEPWQIIEQGGITGLVAMGRSSLGFVNRHSQPFALEGTSTLAVMDGEIHDMETHRRALSATGVAIAGNNQTELLTKGYLHEGPQFFRRLDGKFTIAIWDSVCRQLVIANDKFGMKPLYFARAGGKLLFASEIKALLSHPDVDRQRNWRGIVQFFTLGHLWNEDTFHSGVRALRPSTCMIYDVDHDQVRLDRYWRLAAQLPSKDIDISQLMERIDVSLQRAVASRVEGTEGLGLSLSGGLDARTILAIVDHAQNRLTTVSIGIEGSLDHRSARKMATLAACPHHEFLLGGKFLSDFESYLRRMVMLTDGHYLSQCIVMPTLPFLRELGIRVLLRGHAGEMMHLHKAYNFSVDRRAMQIKSVCDLRSWLLLHLRAWMVEGLGKPLLAGMNTGDMECLTVESLNEALAESDDFTVPVDRICHLFLTQRLRRETAMSLVKFGSVVETRLPFVSGDVIESLLASPSRLRIGEDIQTYLLRRHCPAMAEVINANTGAPVGASFIRRRISHMRLRVMAKLGVRGYQPYERLGLWLRRELRQFVETTLLSPTCLDRGIFNPDTVRHIMHQHVTGQNNHTFLIMAMIIFELGQCGPNVRAHT